MAITVNLLRNEALVPIIAALNAAMAAQVTTSLAGGGITLGTGGSSTYANVDINSGSIDGTAIGANSASTGTFTTLSASGQITGATFAPGVDTPKNYFQAYGANSNWPYAVSTIYGATNVDQIISLNTILTGGTQAAPLFSGSTGTIIRQKGDGTFSIATVASGAAKAPVDAITVDTAQNTSFGGTISALKAGTATNKIESSVNGALAEFIAKGKNSTGTARQMNFGLNKFADDVFSFYDGTTERLRLGVTTGDLTVSGNLVGNGTGVQSLASRLEIKRADNTAAFQSGHLTFKRGDGSGVIAGVETLGDGANGVDSLLLTVGGTAGLSIKKTTLATTLAGSVTSTSTAATYGLVHSGGLLSATKYYTGFRAGELGISQGSVFGHVYDSTTPANSFSHISPYGDTEGAKFKIVDATGNTSIGGSLTLTGGVTGASPTGQLFFQNYYNNSANPKASHIVLYDQPVQIGIGVAANSIDYVAATGNSHRFYSDPAGSAVTITSGGLTAASSITANGGILVAAGNTIAFRGTATGPRLSAGGTELIAGGRDTDGFLELRPQANATAGRMQLTTTAATLDGGATFAVSNTTDASSSTAGAVTVAGGLAVAKKAYFGNTVTASASSATGFNQAFDTAGVTTGRAQSRLQNTSGSFIHGVEGSTAGASLTGSLAYSSFSGSFTATPYYLVSNGVIGATLDPSDKSLALASTTEATTTSDGALRTLGGLSVAKNGVFGGSITAAGDAIIGGNSVTSALNSRASSGGIYFPGVAGARATATLTNQNIGTDDVSFHILGYQVPTANPAASLPIFYTGSSATTQATAESFTGYINTDGTLNCNLNNTGALGNYRTATVAGFRAAYSGQFVNITFTRSGTTLVIKCNGTALTYTDTTTGSAPTWAGTITSTYFGLGYFANASVFSGIIHGAILYNRALSAADITALIRDGYPAPADQWASQVPVYSTDFSSATGWTLGDSGTQYTISGGVATVATTGDLGGSTALKRSLSGGYGYYEITYTIGGLTSGGFRPQFAGTNGTLRTANGTYIETILGSSGTLLYFFQNANVGATLDDLKIKKSGCIAFFPCAESTGSTCYDASGNTTGLALVGGAVLANPGPATVPVQTLLASNAITLQKASGIAYNSVGSGSDFLVSFTSDAGDPALYCKSTRSLRIGTATATDGTGFVAGLTLSPTSVSIPLTTAATAVNTGALKSANFGFSGNLGGPSFLGGDLTASGDLVFGGTNSVSSSLNSRASSGGIYFPGVAGARATATLTNQAFGTDPFTDTGYIIAPATLGSGYAVSGFSTSASTLSAAGTAFAVMQSTGALRIEALNAAGNGGVYYDFVGVHALLTTPAGAKKHWGWGRDATGAPFVEIDGAIVTVPSAVTFGTNPGTFATANITGTYHILGYFDGTNAQLNGRIDKSAQYNRPLSSSDIAALIATGYPAPADQWGSQVSLVTGDNSTFASDTGYWTKNGTATIGSGAATLTSGGYLSKAALQVIGKKYRIKIVVTSLSTPITCGSNSLVIATTTGTTITDFTAIDTQLAFGPSAGGNAVVDTFEIYQLGCIAYYPCTENTGTIAYNSSTNTGLDMTLVGGAVLANPGPSTVPFNAVTTSDTTDATSLTAASVKMAGGLAVTKNIFVSGRTIISQANPIALFVETDQAANATTWGLQSEASVFKIRAFNDAVSTAVDGININRTGDVLFPSTTAATAVNTGAIKGANFGFSGTLYGDNFLGGPLIVSSSSSLGVPTLKIQNSLNASNGFTALDILNGTGTVGRILTANSVYSNANYPAITPGSLCLTSAGDVGIVADGTGVFRVQTGTGSSNTRFTIANNGAATFAGSVGAASIASTGVVTKLGTFAGIYIADGSTLQNVATGTTYATVTGFNTAQGANGESSDCTADKANNRIAVTRVGRYHVSWSWSGQVDTTATTARMTVFLDSTEQNAPHGSTKFSNATDIQELSGHGYVNVTSVAGSAGYITLRVRHDRPGTVGFTPLYCNMTATYAGN